MASLSAIRSDGHLRFSVGRRKLSVPRTCQFPPPVAAQLQAHTRPGGKTVLRMRRLYAQRDQWRSQVFLPTAQSPAFAESHSLRRWLVGDTTWGV
ncbi:hypothetical protein LA080_006106 [Diaporthe eres]|nr:hypothetical protein LA080_006106 [Diaporthe eres]